MAYHRLLLVVVLCFSAPVFADDQPPLNRDPLEPFNRVMFTVNDKLDKYLLRPVAKGYDFVMPDVAQRGVGNFFANLYDFNAAINGVLQGRLGKAGHSTGRFLVNSTVGVLGLFDVATPMGISPYRTDFGHTLAIWGFDSGPYLMVPVFGPRTIRSGLGTVFDTYTAVPTFINDDTLRYSVWGLELVDGRARLLDGEKLITGDRYIFLREAYLQDRDTLVNDGKVQDSFSNFGEQSDDWEDF